ncbi:MAG: TonB family protein [Gemmatimonas sp.]
MIAAWMFGSILFALLLFIAAYAVERALRSTGRATRLPWAFSLAAAIVWPFAAPFIITLPAEPASVVTTAEPLRQQSPNALAMPAPSVDWGARVETVLLCVWLTLTVVMLVRLVLAARALRQITATAKPERIDDEDVLVTDALGPAVVGLWKPRIAVPEWFLQLDSSLRRVVLRHEREHCDSRDPQLVWLASVAVAIMPWNPGVWMLSRRLRLALEIDCDSRTLRGQPDTRTYSQLLLLIAQRQSGYPLASMLAESNSHLRRRITAMQMTPLRKPAVRVVLFTGIAAGAVAAACSPRIASDLAGPGEKPVSMVAAKKEAELMKPGTVFFESQVEQPVAAAPGSPGPKYPADLRAQRIQGTVLAMFVVDEQGLADSATLKVLRADNPAFDLAVREALPNMRFVPAQIGGRNVKQLVQQPFSFALSGGEPKASLKGVLGSGTPGLRTGAPDDSRTTQAVVVATRKPVPTVVAGQPYFESQVEKPVGVARGSIGPAYPDALKSQGIEGVVLAAFVVDVDGTADVSTFKVYKSDNEEFTNAVRTALPKMLFTPAEVGGRPVRQLVQQPFTFSLSR